MLPFVFLHFNNVRFRVLVLHFCSWRDKRFQFYTIHRNQQDQGEDYLRQLRSLFRSFVHLGQYLRRKWSSQCCNLFFLHFHCQFRPTGELGPNQIESALASVFDFSNLNSWTQFWILFNLEFLKCKLTLTGMFKPTIWCKIRMCLVIKR